MGALVINLPRTPAGRELLRETITASGLRPEYPDGTRLPEIDWDMEAVEVARSAAEYAAYVERLKQ